MWRKLYTALNVTGEIAKNLLAISALIAVVWAGVVLFYGDSPLQRLVDRLTHNQRLGNAVGWVWLGDGQSRADYQFALLKGSWVTSGDVELPAQGAIVRSTSKRNVRKEAGPWSQKVSYIVAGDCVEVTDSNVLGPWGGVRIQPIP
jgi:hypothetical protein